AAGCYATTTQVFRELREAMRQRASIRGVSLMGPGQEGAIAGRPAHDHRMNSPSSGTHTAHYSPVMIAPLSINSSHADCALFFLVASGQRAALMEAAPCCKSMISVEAWPRLIRSRPC